MLDKNKLMKKQFLIILFVFIVSSCEKENDSDIINYAEIISYDIVGKDVDCSIDSDNQLIKLLFKPDVVTADNLIAEFDLSEGASATIDDIIQVSGQTSNNFEMPLIYTITSANGKITNDWYVYGTNNEFSVSWGLGQFEKQTLSKDRTYSWYLDQGNTGEYSNINCGPTSTTMAAKWSDGSFSKTPQDAREAYRSSGGWWYTSDIDNYLSDNQIPHNYISLSTNTAGTQQIIKDELDSGNILILCLDMYCIRYESFGEHRINKFYQTNSSGWGHFIVVKGYKQVDEIFYFEIYDPFSLGQMYKDNTLKGKNRYYRSDDIYTATSIWWNYAIVVSEKGSKNKSKANYIKNTTLIPDMWGR